MMVKTHSTIVKRPGLFLLILGTLSIKTAITDIIMIHNNATSKALPAFVSVPKIIS
jgi:hypothetical protein